MLFILKTSMILFSCFSQINSSEQAEAILEKSLTNLGGEKYLQIKTIFSQGNFTIFRDGTPFLIQTFIDIVVLPNKERTDFKSSGEKIVQVNVGNSGWIGDTATQSLRDQSPEQVKNFIKSIRTSIHNLLSRNWKTEGAKISYIGKREASVGKRNDVVKLSYPDGFEVEFEFSSEGLPVKVLYKTKSSEGEEVVEEDRYAQFIEVQGVLTPFIIDHYKNGIQVSRINFTEVVYNKPVPEQIFQKPKSIKELKRTPRL